MRRIAVLLGLVGVVFVAVFLWQAIAGADGSPEPAGNVSATESAPSAALRSAESTATANEPGTPETRTSVAPEIVDARAVISGRCVDEAGAPLAGIAVKLWGNEGGSARMAEYRMEHGEPEWKAPEPVTSDVDGRFELRFAPIEAYAYSVLVMPKDRVWVEQRWPRIDAGAVIDLGDVALPRGVLVRGTIADAQGTAIAGQSVYLGREDDDARREGPRVAAFGFGQSDARGAFALDRALPPGTYRAQAGGRTLRDAAKPIAIAMPDADLQLVVETVDEAPGSTIRGTVVDVRGTPLARAELFVGDDGYTEANTNRSGNFTLPRREDRPRAAVPLGARLDGYESWRAPEPISWGTRDLRITLAEGPPLTIRVRRKSDRTPLERFGIHRVPARRSGWSSRDEDVLFAGVHEGGVLALPHATTGSFLIRVAPAESTGLPPSAMREVAIEPGVPAIVEFELAPLAERVVSIVDTHDAPVPGARVELLRHLRGGTVQLATLAMDERNARAHVERAAMLCGEATSDASGRVTLRGHGELDYALRLPGPGNVPMVVQPFRLDEQGEARVVVGSGALIRGRIEPRDVVEMLVAESVPADRRGDEDLVRRNRPGVCLVGHGARAGETFPLAASAGTMIPIADDGSFLIAGIPSGTWQLVFEGQRYAGSLASTTRRSLGGELMLAGSDERELVVDISSWVRRRVTLDVHMDGAPHAGIVTFEGKCGVDASGEEQREQFRSRTDERGIAELGLPEGEWQVTVQAKFEDRWCSLPGPRFAVTRDPQPLRVLADLRSARRRITVLDPDGAPAARAVLRVENSEGGRFGSDTAADSAGQADLLGFPHAVRLLVRCAPLMDDQSYSKWARQTRDDPQRWRRAWIDAGVVELLPGGGEPLTIRLPPEWREMPKD